MSASTKTKARASGKSERLHRQEMVERSMLATRRTTHLIDGVVVMTSLLCLLATLGVDGIFGRRWFVVAFSLLGPGWAVLRACGRSASSVTVFLAAAASLASMQVTGHLAVTVFDWHWAAPMAALTLATLVGTTYGWFRDDVLPTVSARADFPLGLVERPGSSGEPHSRVGFAAIVLTGAFGAILALGGLTQTDTADLGRLGLFPALPVTVFLGAGLVVIAAVVVTDGSPRGRLSFVGLVGALTALLFGSVGVIEAHPRFSVAWLHAGFMDSIATRGELLPGLDARFSWPGFFAGGGLVQEVAGTDDVVWLIRFFPVVAIGLLALGVWSLGRVLGMTEKSCAIAVVVFVVFDWSAQDYFSPQAVAVILYVAIVTLVLGLFPGAGPDPEGRLAKILRLRPGSEVRPLDGVPRAVAMGIILFLTISMVISHQLSPIFLIGVLLLLGMTNLTSLRWLGVTTAVVTLAWLSFGGEAWWTGNLDALLGPLGDVGAIVQENVGGRASGAIPERSFVVALRVGLTLTLWMTAAVAVWSARRRRGLDHATVALAVMVVAVVPPILAQPYGGELLIRIFLFSAIPGALLIGEFLHRRALRQRLVLGVVLAAVVPLFFIARFGNEEYEIITDAQIATSDALLDVAPDGSVVITGNNITLFYVDRVGEVRFVDGQAADAADFDERVKSIDHEGPTFVYFTESQQLYEQYTRGFDAGWLEAVVDDLEASGDYVVHYRDGVNAVLELTR